MSWSCPRHWALITCKIRRPEPANTVRRPPVARNAWQALGFRGRMAERPGSLLEGGGARVRMVADVECSIYTRKKELRSADSFPLRDRRASRTRADALLGLKPAATNTFGVDYNPFHGHSTPGGVIFRKIGALARPRTRS